MRRGPTEAPTGCDLRVNWSLSSEVDTHEAAITVATARKRYPYSQPGMAGLFQRANAACAVAAVEQALFQRGVTLSASAVREGLAATSLPGRLEQIQMPGGPLLVLDGAHNALAAAALAETVASIRHRGKLARLLLVIGMLDGHVPADVLALLAPQSDAVYVCRPNWRCGLDTREVAEAARRFATRVYKFGSVADAVNQAVADAGPRDMVLITGSFYTVGEGGFIQEPANNSRVPA